MDLSLSTDLMCLLFSGASYLTIYLHRGKKALIAHNLVTHSYACNLHASLEHWRLKIANVKGSITWHWIIVSTSRLTRAEPRWTRLINTPPFALTFHTTGSHLQWVRWTFDHHKFLILYFWETLNSSARNPSRIRTNASKVKMGKLIRLELFSECVAYLLRIRRLTVIRFQVL